MGQKFGNSNQPVDIHHSDVLGELEMPDDVPAPAAEFVSRLGANLRQRQQHHVSRETAEVALTHSAASRGDSVSGLGALERGGAPWTVDVLGHIALIMLLCFVVVLVYVGPFQQLNSHMGARTTPTSRVMSNGPPCPERQGDQRRNDPVVSTSNVPTPGYRPRIDVDGTDITPATANGILATLRALVACDGHYGQLANLYTPEFFVYHYNYQAAILIPLKPAGVTIWEPRRINDGRVVAEVRIDGCVPRLVAFKRLGEVWLIDDVQPLNEGFAESCVATPVAGPGS